MPELPEVETVKETLKRLVIGKKIIGVTVNYSNIIEYLKKKLLIKLLMILKEEANGYYLTLIIIIFLVI